MSADKITPEAGGMSDIKRKKATLIIEDDTGHREVFVSVNVTIRWSKAEGVWRIDDPEVGTFLDDNLHVGLLGLLGMKLGIEP